MPDQFDVAIIGGGVIGSSIAWRLARENRRVLLLDAAQIGSEASSAAAGMLAPGGEFDSTSPLLDFALASFAQYPGFVEAIQADSGLPIEFRHTSAVQIAHTADELAALSARAASQRAAGIPSAVLTGEDVHSLAPLARPDAIGAVHYTDEAVIDPSALAKSLRAACLARGVCAREGSPVASIAVSAGGVQIAGFSARFAVLAAGAWSSGVHITIDDQPSRLARAFPVKGHLLGYRLPPGSLTTTIRYGHTYVLQRADGFTIAGSSTEHAGFDRTIDPAIVADLAARAGALAPALRDVQPESVWVGFRPGTDAPSPHLGRVQSSRLWLAYGHYRNGILLAPATSDRICREIAAALE